MTHKYKELMRILIEEGEIDPENKIEVLNNKKSDINTNKSQNVSCCTISTKPLEEDSKVGTINDENNNENKTVIIGKAKENKNKNDDENKKDEEKNKVKSKICTKTISI